MKLNKSNKHDVKTGDILKFSYGDAYYVIGILEHQRGGISFSLQDVKTKQTIYGLPASHCYGAEIIRTEK